MFNKCLLDLSLRPFWVILLLFYFSDSHVLILLFYFCVPVFTNLIAYISMCFSPIARKPTSCVDVKEYDVFSGQHTVFVPGTQPFRVYCDQSVEGGGWTVKNFQIVSHNCCHKSICNCSV